MGETKDTSVRVGCSVAHHGPKRFEAYLPHASGSHAAYGSGETAAEAKAALVASLQWMAHVVPGQVQDSEGAWWLLHPHGHPGEWCARRIVGGATGQPRIGDGATIFGEPNWTHAKRRIGTW